MPEPPKAAASTLMPKPPTMMQRWSAARAQKRNQRVALRDKEGSPVARTWDKTMRPFIDGTAFEVLSYAATGGATAAGVAAIYVKSPEAKSAWTKAAAALTAGAASAKLVAVHQKSKLSLQGERFMQRVLTDPEFARRAEYDLVRRFSRNPKGTMELYDTDALGIASVFSVLHKRRKSPDGGYSMSRHEESVNFRNVMEPILKHHVLRTPDLADNMVYKVIQRHGFGIRAGELRRIRKLQVTNPEVAAQRTAIPSGLSALLPSSLEQATPSTLRQVEDVVLFSSAVIRAKQNKFKKNGVVKPS